MTKQEIVEKVNLFLIEKLEINPELVKPESELRRDIGLTSLDAMHIYIYMKQQFGILPVEDDIKSLVLLQDLYDYIEKGKLLGEVKGKKLYMVFSKDGKYLNYKDYI